MTFACVRTASSFRLSLVRLSSTSENNKVDGGASLSIKASFPTGASSSEGVVIAGVTNLTFAHLRLLMQIYNLLEQGVQYQEDKTTLGAALVKL